MVKEFKLSGETDRSVEVNSNPGKGASLLILTQVLSKLFTFLLNQLLVRYISPSIFGVSAYLEFLYSTILFFSREAARLSIQRTKPYNEIQQTHQSILNFSFLTVIIGIPISIAIIMWQLSTDTVLEIRSSMSYFNYTISLFWGLTILELLVEPIYALNQYSLDFGNRSKYEGMAVFLRCVVTVVIVLNISDTNIFNRNGLVLLGFGIGQFIYSFTLFVCYLSNYSNYSVSLVPSKLSDGSFINSEVLSFWKISFIQMIFKQVLTEGDKYIINSFFSVDERGVYSVMNNYGSIIVRLLFQPIEESVRLSFTRILSQIKKSSSIKDYQDALNTIKYLLIFYLQFSILIYLGGYFNGSYLLKILLGGKSSNWLDTDLFQVFPFYICYIPFLAFNGVLEGFLMAISNPTQTKYYTYFMSMVSIFVLVLLYYLIEVYHLGIRGLILANIINMTLRIIYCGIFVSKFFTNSKLRINYSNMVSFISKNLAIVLIGHYANVSIGPTKTFIGFTKSVGICVISLLLMLLIIRRDLFLLFKKVYRKQD